MKQRGVQNVPINAFHDSRATIAHIQTTVRPSLTRYIMRRTSDNVDICQVENLYHRTGTEFLIFAARTSHEDYMCPYMLSTSRRIEDFFQATMRQGPTEFALKLEAFCLTGLDGRTPSSR